MSISFYENVYCGNVAGLLQISEDGLAFQPYNFAEASPCSLLWDEVSDRKLNSFNVKAEASGYATSVTVYELEVTSRQSDDTQLLFQLQNLEDWERLRADLEGLGEAQETSHVVNEAEGANGNVKQDFGSERDEPLLQPEITSSQEEAIMKTNPNAATQSQQDETPSKTDSKYYPVYCHQQKGTLHLKFDHIQFIPDQLAAAVKTFPYTSFSNSPYFSPVGYPQPTMRIYYHVTHGNNRQTDFVMENHNVLEQVEVDVTDRSLPFKNHPRCKVPVPQPGTYFSRPSMESEESRQRSSSNSLFSLRGFPSKSLRASFSSFVSDKSLPKDNKKASTDAAGETQERSEPSESMSPASLEGDEHRLSFRRRQKSPKDRNSSKFESSKTEFYEGSNSSSDELSRLGTPLIYGKPRKARKPESPMRVALLACLVCFGITLAGLLFSLTFGYFFGERRPAPQNLRSHSHNIDDYLGTGSPKVGQPVVNPSKVAAKNKRPALSNQP